MSTSLYQKYRPQQFADVVGQHPIRTTLLNELRSGEPSHAYLFSGSRGVGKTTTARILARAVNCQQPVDGEPCNACEHCTMILAGKALDIIEIDAASHTGVDHVRENIIENARVAPTRLPWKVFIIDEVHMLSTSAFNALLKTLEEPPRNTMFILATTELHKVPATIISRCEQFQFKRVSYDHLIERLADLAKREGVMVDREVLEAIARRSDGALRDAESVLGQVLALDDAHVTAEIAEIILPSSNTIEMLQFFEEIVRLQTADAITRVNRLVEEGVQLPEFTKEFIDFLRSVLLYRVQESLVPLDALNIHADQMQKLSQLAGELSVQLLARMIEIFLRAHEQYRLATIPQLPLELAVIALCDSGMANTTQPTAQMPISPKAKTVNAQKKAKAPSAPATPASPSTAPSSNLTLDDVRGKWAAVLDAMRHQNHSLHLSLQVGSLVSFDGHVLVLGFQYQFYQDRLNDARNRPVVDGVLRDVLGHGVIVETVVGKQYAFSPTTANNNIEQPTPEEVANVWDLAANSFGPQS
jgi:DNA polymerase-3 subunit gamma/tau